MPILGPRSTGDDDEEEASEFYRKLLSSLIYVDEAVAKPGRPAGWLINARDVLRQLLLVNPRYEILEGQLIGRSIRTCENLVSAVGFMQGGATPTNHIADVRLPGYVVKLPNGSTDVVRRAQVLLTE